jgi:hypothetical protein
MALVDGVSFVAAAAGTGTFAFGSSRPSFLTLAQAVTDGELANGQTVSYLAQDSITAPTQREWGHGTFSSAGSGSIARTTVLGNSLGTTSAINFTVPPIVSLTVLAEDLLGTNGLIHATSDLTFYVSTTGSDSNPGTLAEPWATPQHAADYIISTYDFAGWLITVQLEAGSYPGVVIFNPYSSANANVASAGITAGAGSPLFVFQGNAADATAVVLTTPAGHGGMFICRQCNLVWPAVANMTLDGSVNTQDDAPSQIHTGTMFIGDGTGGTVIYKGGPTTSCGDAISAVENGLASLNDNIIVNGGKFDYILSADGGNINSSSWSGNQTTVTLENNPSYAGAFAVVGSYASNGLIDDFAAYSGTGTGPRFECNGPLATINVNWNAGGLDFYPGTSAGIVSAAGTYIFSDVTIGSLYLDDGSWFLNQASSGYLVAALPTPSNTGARTKVRDALSPVFGSAPVGGGGVCVPVFYGSSGWIVG